jgi:hypothetical protein
MGTTHKARRDPETLYPLFLSLATVKETKNAPWERPTRGATEKKTVQTTRFGRDNPPEKVGGTKREVRQDATLMWAVAACRTSKATRHVPHATPQFSCKNSPLPGRPCFRQWRSRAVHESPHRVTPSCPSCVHVVGNRFWWFLITGNIWVMVCQFPL